MKAFRVAPDRLRIPVRVEGPNGEIGDGMLDIGPEHPDYSAWADWAEPLPDDGAPETAS